MYKFKNKNHLYAAIAIFAVLALVIWYVAKPPKIVKPQTPAVQVKTTKATQDNIPHILNAVGTAESLQSVVVRTQVDGTLTELHFKEGEHVEKGQLLAKIDDRSLKAALASAEAAKLSNVARLEAAELDLKRYQSLSDSKAISRQMYDQQVATVAQLKAAVKGDDANIDNAKVQLSYTNITSPVTGRVGIRRVDSGNLVRTSDAEGIVAVAQVNPISVVFTIPQNQLSALRSTMQNEERKPVEAIDRESSKSLGYGKISAVDNAVQAGSGTVQVRAEFDNAEEKFWPGQFVSVKVPVGTTSNAVIVPFASVRIGLNGPFVFGVEDGSAKIINVETGYTDNEIAVITKGVKAGDEVITDGFARLTGGTKIKISNSESEGAAPPTTATEAK